MALINTSKPSSSISNQTKINIGETWDAATMTWNAASFTWDSTQSVIDNATKAFSGFIWAYSILPWQLTTPWIDTGIITNQAKP